MKVRKTVLIIVGGILIIFLVSLGLFNWVVMPHLGISSEPKQGKYFICLDEVCFAGKDWGVNILGNPLDIELSVWKDKKRVFHKMLDGKRGTRRVRVSFEMDYVKHSEYKILIVENALVSKYWTKEKEVSPFQWFNGKISVGDYSWLKFHREKVE